MRTTTSFAAALAHGPFRRLLLGHALGTVAQVALTLAVGVQVLEGTGSAAWVSASVAVGFAPYVLLSGLAGVLADRCSRSAVLGWSFALRAGVTAVLLAGLAGGWATGSLVLLSAAAAALATPAYPALLAATPELVPDEHLTPANALVTGVENAAWIAGPGALGLVLLTGGGPAAAVGLSGALFLAAGLVVLAVRLPRPVRPSTADGPVSVRADLLEGLRAVTGVRRVRLAMSVAVLDNFLYGFLVVAVVLLGHDGLAGAADGDRAAGWLSASLAVGALAGMLVCNRVTGRGRPPDLLGLLMLGFAGAVALLAGSGHLAVAAVLVLVAGAGTLLAEIVAVTLVQREADRSVTARVFGVYDQLNVGAIALGSALAGPLADLVGVRASLAVVGLGVAVGSTVAVRALAQPRDREALSALAARTAS